MFFNHNEVKLKDNNEEFGVIHKCVKIKQHTSNQKVKEEITIKIERLWVEQQKKKHTYQKLWNAAKAMIKGKWCVWTPTFKTRKDLKPIIRFFNLTSQKKKSKVNSKQVGEQKE